MAGSEYYEGHCRYCGEDYYRPDGHTCVGKKKAEDSFKGKKKIEDFYISYIRSNFHDLEDLTFGVKTSNGWVRIKVPEENV